MWSAVGDPRSATLYPVLQRRVREGKSKRRIRSVVQLKDVYKEIQTKIFLLLVSRTEYTRGIESMQKGGDTKGREGLRG